MIAEQTRLHRTATRYQILHLPSVYIIHYRLYRGQCDSKTSKSSLLDGHAGTSSTWLLRPWWGCARASRCGNFESVVARNASKISRGYLRQPTLVGRGVGEGGRAQAAPQVHPGLVLAATFASQCSQSRLDILERLTPGFCRHWPGCGGQGGCAGRGGIWGSFGRHFGAKSSKQHLSATTHTHVDTHSGPVATHTMMVWDLGPR
jgi:hypothetical protein